jgi:hypothetical protein
VNRLHLLWLRLTVAAWLPYRGTMKHGDRSYRVYSRYPLLRQTAEGMEFRGGMWALAEGGIRLGGKGRVVMLWIGHAPGLDGDGHTRGIDRRRHTAAHFFAGTGR